MQVVLNVALSCRLYIMLLCHAGCTYCCCVMQVLQCRCSMQVVHDFAVSCRFYMILLCHADCTWWCCARQVVHNAAVSCRFYIMLLCHTGCTHCCCVMQVVHNVVVMQVRYIVAVSCRLYMMLLCHAECTHCCCVVQDESMVQQLSTVVYQCVVQEKADAICPHFVLHQVSPVSKSCTEGPQTNIKALSVENPELWWEVCLPNWPLASLWLMFLANQCPHTDTPP